MVIFQSLLSGQDDKLGKTVKEKIGDFAGSTADAVLALLSLVIDAAFWIVWGYVTSRSGQWVESLKVTGVEAWPYKISQIAGCGVLAWFVLIRTVRSSISIWDNFTEFLGDRDSTSTGN